MDLALILNFASLILGVAGSIVAARKTLIKTIAKDTLREKIINEHVEIRRRLKREIEAIKSTGMESVNAVHAAEFEKLREVLVEVAAKLDSRSREQVMEALDQPSQEGRKEYALEVVSNTGVARGLDLDHAQ
jgi:polyribonucleotide nucleotidyltransferase